MFYSSQPVETRRPRIFVASSSKGREAARWFQTEIGVEEKYEVVCWWQGVFEPSVLTLESLEKAARDFDYAVVIATPDDVRIMNAHEGKVPRDNVIFELGFFIGAFGRKRTFLVCQEPRSLELPTDLKAFTYVDFPSDVSRLRPALGPACARILEKLDANHASRAYEQPDPSKASRRRRRPSFGVARSHGCMHHIVNISVTGALIEAAGELDQGDIVDLDLQLDDMTSISLRAEVVRLQLKTRNMPEGIGVRFTAMDDRTFAALERYVNAVPV
jgi:hypothetical protein